MAEIRYVALDKHAYELALYGLAALESNDPRRMTDARGTILDFLPYLSDPALDELAMGLTRVASCIQAMLDEMAIAPQCV